MTSVSPFRWPSHESLLSQEVYAEAGQQKKPGGDIRGEEPVRQISGEDPSSDGGEADGTENRRCEGRRETAVRQQRHKVGDGPVHYHANKEHGR